MSNPDDDRARPVGLSLVSAPERDLGDRGLSVEALRALRQLERRTRTGDLDAVNIRDAQALAQLGLARHGPGGWRPTPEGLAYLQRGGPEASPDDDASKP
ncbi:hypothetical protein [Caulobacter sp. BP25]|uniref:hypothetical protein n=1 Tax=Caulobacter sp. BP25 TaxID=2048900 RepID=UPI001F2C0B7F|nr:hypothetical protein [Caulobacter sp. BP25]